MTTEIELGDNLSSVLDDEPIKPTQKAGRPKAAKAEAEELVWIILEDNEQVPPGGQFIQVGSGDGPTRSFLLKAGVEAHVPRCVVDVLDHAIMSIPVKDEFDSVIGYKDRLRFPYRLLMKPSRKE